MLRETSNFADTRIEILAALLNNAEVSKDAFNALKTLVASMTVEKTDNDAFNAYVASLVGEEEEEEETTTKAG